MKNTIINLCVSYKTQLLNIKLHNSSSILRVKQLIYKKYQIPIKKQLLYHNGIYLKNNKSILTYNLNAYSNIEIKHFHLKGGDDNAPNCRSTKNIVLLSVFSVVLCFILYTGGLLKTTNIIDYAVISTIPQFFKFCEEYKQLGTMAFGLFVGCLVFIILQNYKNIKHPIVIFILSYIITYMISVKRIYKLLSTHFIKTLCMFMLLLIKHLFIAGFIFITIGYLTYGILNAIGDCKFECCAVKIAIKIAGIMTLIYYSQVIIFSTIDRIIEFITSLKRDILPFSAFARRYGIGFKMTKIQGAISVPTGFGVIPSSTCMYNDHNSYKLSLFMPLSLLYHAFPLFTIPFLLLFPGCHYIRHRNAHNNKSITWVKKVFTFGDEKYVNRESIKGLTTYLNYHQFLKKDMTNGSKSNTKLTEDTLAEFKKLVQKDKNVPEHTRTLLDDVTGDDSLDPYKDGCAEFIRKDLYKYLENAEKYQKESDTLITNPAKVIASLLEGTDQSLLYAFEYSKLSAKIKRYNFWKNYLVKFYGVLGVNYDNLNISENNNNNNGEGGGIGVSKNVNNTTTINPDGDKPAVRQDNPSTSSTSSTHPDEHHTDPTHKGHEHHTDPTHKGHEHHTDPTHKGHEHHTDPTHKGHEHSGGSIYTSEPFYHHHRKYIRGGGAPDVDKIKRTIETTVKEEIKEEFEDRFSPSMQSEKASDEKLDPKIIGLLNKYLKSYYTNVVASSGLYTAWVITIICIVSMDEMFGHQYR